MCINGTCRPAGSEGTILRDVKTALARGNEGAEKVTTTVGEAYFDDIFPVSIGRVGTPTCKSRRPSSRCLATP
jgi:hypothetical protein